MANNQSPWTWFHEWGIMVESRTFQSSSLIPDVLRRFVIAADAVLDVVFVYLSTSVLKLLSVNKNNFNAFKFR